MGTVDPNRAPLPDTAQRPASPQRGLYAGRTLIKYDRRQEVGPRRMAPRIDFGEKARGGPDVRSGDPVGCDNIGQVAIPERRLDSHAPINLLRSTRLGALLGWHAL